jgi:hypothetical protein
LYLGCQLLSGECQEYSIPAIVPQSVLGIGFHRTLEPNLKLKGGRLSGKSSGSAITPSSLPSEAIALLTAGIPKSNRSSPKAGFLISGWFGDMIESWFPVIVLLPLPIT